MTLEEIKLPQKGIEVFLNTLPVLATATSQEKSRNHSTAFL